MINKVVWNKRALKEIRKELGFLIYRLQLGEILRMPFSRPMPTLSQGCHELRAKGEDGNYRVFYYINIKEEVLIFHAFKKKTPKTPQKDLDQGKKNLKEMLDEKE